MVYGEFGRIVEPERRSNEMTRENNIELAPSIRHGRLADDGMGRLVDLKLKKIGGGDYVGVKKGRKE
jgi:hypothetical protein